MDDTTNRDVSAEHVPAELVPGAHVSDGTLGQVGGTGTGAISGGLIGAVAGGPVGAVIGAVAGGVVGAATGDGAHHIGDDHDEVNINTGSDGELGRTAGLGAGALSGALIGAVAGPVVSVVGAVAGGLLGAAAGDAAKDMGDRDGTSYDDTLPPVAVVDDGSVVDRNDSV